MKITLTLQNFRCFVRPTKLPIVEDFTGFVGMNNAGKSALMRFLLEFRPLFSNLEQQEPQLFASLTQGGQTFGLNQVLDSQEVFSNIEAGPIKFSIEFEADDGEAHEPNEVRFAHFTYHRSQRLDLSLTAFNGTALGAAGGINRHGERLYSQANVNQIVNAKRFMSLLRDLANTLYIGPFRNTVSVGTNSDYIDIQIGQAFITRFREYKSGNTKKFNDDILRLTEDIARIFEFRSLSIDSTPDNQSLHIAINGRSYKQHELGAGLAQFILVLANASTRNPAYILIDEPELGLHPKLQLDFLTTLATYASKGVWFSTHSLGLARSVTDNIFSVRRINDGDSQVTHYGEVPRLAEFLGEMSFASHQEVGFERVLLVEGPTDVKTFQQFLRKFQLDHKVLIITLSGRIVGDMAEELLEVLRITDKVSAIIDSERTAAGAPLSAQRESFVRQCGQLGIPCCVLERRATENYFPDRAVKRALGAGYGALSEFQKLDTLQPRWAKSQNWRLAHAMTKDEVAATDLGAFLAAL